MNVYYKSKFTGIEIDQRLAQGTYDDAVKAGFTGTKEEFDQLTWAFGKEQQELLKTAQQQRADKLETESKNIVEAINEVYHRSDNSQVLEELSKKQNIQDDNLQTSNKTIVSAINEIKGSVDSISDPYEINLTNLLSAEDSESISTAIGGIDNLNATVQDNRLIVGTISNGSVSVSIRILGNVTTLYYLLDSVVGLTLNEIAITNTSGTLSKRITTHSVLTENMVINSLTSDETTLPLSAAQGKVLATDKQDKTDDSLNTEDKTIIGAINEILPKATGVGKVASNGTGEIFNSYEGGTANEATGIYSHAEGNLTTAKGMYSHAEGFLTKAEGGYSHAEGNATIAGGNYSHAEGVSTNAWSTGSHAEGSDTIAEGRYSHAEGRYTKTHSQGEHAEGTCNKSYNSGDVTVRVIHSVGIGSSTNDRKNAHEIKFNGDHYVYGLGNFDGTNSADAQTLQEVINSKQKTITAGTGLAFDDNTLNVTLDTTVFFVSRSAPASPTDEQKKKICLVPADATEDGNFYTEYVWVVDEEHPDGYWEEFGTYKSEVDLTPYLKIEDAKSTYATKNELQEVQNNVNRKQDTLVSGQNIKSIDGETLLGEGNIEIKYPFPSEDSQYTASYFIDADNYDYEKFSQDIKKGVDIIRYKSNFYRIYQANWSDGYWWVCARDVQNLNKELWFEANKFSVKDTKHFQTSTDETLQTIDKTVVGAINEVKSAVDTIPGIYELNGLTPLITYSPTSEQISTVIGGWDNLVAAIRSKKLIIDRFIRNEENSAIVYVYYSMEDDNTIMLSSVVSGTSFYILIKNTNGILSLVSADIEDSLVNIENKLRKIENQQPYYVKIELISDYTILAYATTREYIYEISIGATTYNIITAEGIKWIDNNPPLVEANSKLIISVINNIAVWGTVYE